MVFILSINSLCAQVSRSGEPVSWNLPEDLTENLNIFSLETVDSNVLLAEDLVETEDKDIPLRFAQKQAVNFDLYNSGRWSNLSNGDRIWLLGIHSDGAKSLSVTFEDFYLPKGAALYLYTPDRSEIIGALTNDNNKSSGVLTTAALSGEDLLIEYYEPYAVRQEGEITIRTISHSYRAVNAQATDFLNSTECMLNTICLQEEGQREVSSSTVLLTVDDGSRWCTGTLVNNANFDGKPYLITSTHNLVGDPDSWLFTFKHSSANCSPSVQSRASYSLSGATLLEVSDENGLVLLELSTRPLPNWDVFYAGWDVSGATPQQVYTVHHPKGNIKKFTSHDSAPTQNMWAAMDVWSVENWSTGSTTAGSTGAGFFNQNNRLIGTLLGGDSECGVGGTDHFSLMSEAWTSFEKYLNPFNENISILDGTYFQFGEVNTKVFEDNIAIFPNPAVNSFNIVNGNGEAIEQINVFDLAGRIVFTHTYNGQPINIEMLPVGNYIIQIQLETQSIQTNLVKLN